jgi:hypothetical protein
VEAVRLHKFDLEGNLLGIDHEGTQMSHSNLLISWLSFHSF